MMRTTGSVPPTVVAATEEGYVFGMPTALPDDAVKDRSAEAARLFNIAHAINALVLVVEAWAKLPDARGHLDTESPPSESPDRKEVVPLMLEDPSRRATSPVPTPRAEAAAFTAFGKTAPGEFGAAGRFARLIPRNKPEVREAAQAKATRLSLGRSIINRAFNPTLN